MARSHGCLIEVVGFEFVGVAILSSTKQHLITPRVFEHVRLADAVTSRSKSSRFFEIVNFVLANVRNLVTLPLRAFADRHVSMIHSFGDVVFPEIVKRVWALSEHVIEFALLLVCSYLETRLRLLSNLVFWSKSTGAGFPYPFFLQQVLELSLCAETASRRIRFDCCMFWIINQIIRMDRWQGPTLDWVLVLSIDDSDRVQSFSQSGRSGAG